MKVVNWWSLSIDESCFFLWKLSFDERCLLMKVVQWWKLPINESYNSQRSDILWRFACGDVIYYYVPVVLYRRCHKVSARQQICSSAASIFGQFKHLHGYVAEDGWTWVFIWESICSCGLHITWGFGSSLKIYVAGIFHLKSTKYWQNLFHFMKKCHLYGSISDICISDTKWSTCSSSSSVIPIPEIWKMTNKICNCWAQSRGRLCRATSSVQTGRSAGSFCIPWTQRFKSGELTAKRQDILLASAVISTAASACVQMDSYIHSFLFYDLHDLVCCNQDLGWM